jgi:hypothetical protein
MQNRSAPQQFLADRASAFAMARAPCSHGLGAPAATHRRPEGKGREGAVASFIAAISPRVAGGEPMRAPSPAPAYSRETEGCGARVRGCDRRTLLRIALPPTLCGSSVSGKMREREGRHPQLQNALQAALCFGADEA